MKKWTNYDKYDFQIFFHFLLHSKLLGFFFRFEIRLLRSMYFEKGQRFTMRQGSTTIGTGVVTQTLPPLTDLEKKLIMESKKKREKLLAELQKPDAPAS